MGIPETELDASLGIHGPFQQYRLSVGGYRVPKLDGRYINGGETMSLVLDERFGIEVPKEIADQVVWFIANALAIGAGYSCHGKHCVPSNPYKCRMVQIDGPDEEAVAFFNDDVIDDNQ